MAQETLTGGDLEAVVGDNAGAGEHRAGYNGLWSLRRRTGQRNVFVPTYAGMNLEHIVDGDEAGALKREDFYEPRLAPMTLSRLSERQVQLHQAPTPRTGVESTTRFTLVAPHYLDFDFRFRTRLAPPRGYLALFWASYIHAPEDKSLYFLGGEPRDTEPRWMQLCTPTHNNQSTVLHRLDRFEMSYTSGYPDALFRNLSPMVFDEPFYYGLLGDSVLMLMFDRRQGVRFVYSPSGGGYHAGERTTNPAWDFLFVHPECRVGMEYGFRARLALRPRCGRAEIEAEYRRWASGE